jgi:aryl-phospho-beta-D-glucosidase BglC (GH1 family)
MNRKYFSSALLSCFGMIALVNCALAQLTPQEAILKMTRGINIGNSLELANEGESGRFVQEHYFTDFKTAGFNCVRIPVRWDKHTSTAEPYKVDSIWLNRVEKVVDWSLKHGLMTIINTHHDDWILNDVNYTAADLARFKAIWTQVAERFKNKSDSLIFEIANEPNIAVSKTDLLNSSAIPVIRNSNPTRIIIFGSSGTQLSTLKQAVVPKDNYLIASFHTYEPWSITYDGKGTWGTTAQINVVKALMNDAAAWSTSHKIPLFLGEFGSTGRFEINSRMKWTYTHVEEALRRNIATAVWSDFGDFGIYNHTTSTTGSWNTAIKDILVYTHPLSAESLTVTVQNKEDAQLAWKNRAADYKWIRIERKVSGGVWSRIDTLEGNATSFLDQTSVLGKTYSYRICCELSTGEIVCSYPADKKIVTPTALNELKSNRNEIELITYFADDELIIKTDFADTELLYNLFSISGQRIKSGILCSKDNHISTSNLPIGIYLINVIYSNGATLTKQAVKF